MYATYCVEKLTTCSSAQNYLGVQSCIFELLDDVQRAVLLHRDEVESAAGGEKALISARSSYNSPAET
jgi:hypothetical protein